MQIKVGNSPQPKSADPYIEVELTLICNIIKTVTIIQIMINCNFIC